MTQHSNHRVSSAADDRLSADPLSLGPRSFRSRLLVGTGKYRDLSQTRDALSASGAEIITVSVRRSLVNQPEAPALLEVLQQGRYTLLPNTAACFTVQDAVRHCHLAREMLGDHKLVKLEVLADPQYLLPDVVQTLEAARILVKEGFEVMVYTSDDLNIALALEQLGCIAVMPLASPIGSGQGIVNPEPLRRIVAALSVPVLVDAGVGTASDVAIAMELGCDGVLLNTAIAAARDPVQMAHAMRLGVEAGRLAYLAGRMAQGTHGQSASPQADQ